jgi:pyruvate formate-lyase activating enzyme-like uncharacterized protein
MGDYNNLSDSTLMLNWSNVDQITYNWCRETTIILKGSHLYYMNVLTKISSPNEDIFIHNCTASTGSSIQ